MRTKRARTWLTSPESEGGRKKRIVVVWRAALFTSTPKSEPVPTGWRSRWLTGCSGKGLTSGPAADARTAAGFVGRPALGAGLSNAWPGEQWGLEGGPPQRAAASSACLHIRMTKRSVPAARLPVTQDKGPKSWWCRLRRAGRAIPRCGRGHPAHYRRRSRGRAPPGLFTSRRKPRQLFGPHGRQSGRGRLFGPGGRDRRGH